jgi:hypothetical protein
VGLVIVHVKSLSSAIVPVPDGDEKAVNLSVVWAVTSQVTVAGRPASVQLVKARIGEIAEVPLAGVVKVKVDLAHLMITVEYTI